MLDAVHGTTDPTPGGQEASSAQTVTTELLQRLQAELLFERTRNIMSLIETAKLHGHDPWAYLKDVFERLPTLKNSELESILPHHWRVPNGTAPPLPAAPAIP